MNRTTLVGGALLGASLLLGAITGAATAGTNTVSSDAEAIAALDSAQAQIKAARDYLASKPTPVPAPTTEPEPPAGGAGTLGVGGAATPSGAVLVADRASKLSITSGGTATAPKTYDCQGRTVKGGIEIKASYVTVQNCRIDAEQKYGVLSEGTVNTIRNNDIKDLRPTGDGDMNAITFFGNKTRILYNTAIDFVEVPPGDSHTDFIQTWVSKSHPTASSDVEIRGNKATGPANPDRKLSIPSIHQCVMVEDYGRGGNSGGSSSGMKNWLVIANTFGDSWNQCIKNDGVDNFVVTKNDFIGSSKKVMEQAAGSGLKFYGDNKVGSGYGSVGVPVTAGAGPA